MRVLVTGADGFAGSWLVRTLLAGGHHVTGTVLSLDGSARGGLTPDESAAVDWRQLQFGDTESVRAALAPERGGWEAIVHLAAIASSRLAGEDPGQTWNVNAAGTVRLLEAIARLIEGGLADPRLLLVSTAEVYGRGEGARPRVETDPLAPLSVYASSKLAAEVAVQETVRRTGLRAMIARAFPHTGPGQQDIYVAPIFLGKLRAAVARGEDTVETGTLETIRDFLDVRDVAAAYLALLERGQDGETYNVASGQGQTLQEMFDILARVVGGTVRPVPVASQMRAWDLPHLVGDATKLREATGWSPRYSFEQTLTDLAHAEAH
ncbi:MAG: GDP-mannose 4,6-dehydratase [Gemmatimonadota bacterium]